ncbi:hypothetical protein CEXT_484461 [Caerostris extrusa]|uniref:Uncharacterized protein n=1 Tax=Caerostris extrusa TaxID=172846 RepID=A0AAV4Y472_CAEEX|nr:hypothetical protein CEXT_484461 [Caerostris extrusa]
MECWIRHINSSDINRPISMQQSTFKILVDDITFSLAVHDETTLKMKALWTNEEEFSHVQLEGAFFIEALRTKETLEGPLAHSKSCAILHRTRVECVDTDDA